MVKSGTAPTHPTLYFVPWGQGTGAKKVLSGEFEMVSAVCG